MKLKSFGCSFVWGSEMSNADKLPSKHTWPALLADHLHMPYQCLARPGSGNLHIAEQILTHVAQEPAVFVINWTYIDRFDYVDPSNDQWNTIRPGAEDSMAQHYYRNLHSQYRDKLTTLMQIKLCVDALEQAGHEFVMTYMDQLIFETEWHAGPAVLNLQQHIQPHMQQFDGMNMLEYSRGRGHSIGHLAHPLESAHADLFQWALGNFGIDKIKTS
jgi:hypothetical protein